MRGSGGQRYDQSIVIEPGHPAIIEGECTCPVGFNCKHVAAALAMTETDLDVLLGS